MATLLVLISNPGTAAIGYLSIAGGVCGIVDGAIWYAQGEEERGIFEIGCSMVEVAGGVKELKQAVELKQLIKEEILKN